MSPPTGPVASARPLIDDYDALLVDLDGVVQLDAQPIDGAAEALARARRAGSHIVFLTNNAARTPADVVERLGRFGVAARVDEVMTSALATARLLHQRFPARSPVLVVGGAGLTAAVSEAGLCPVSTADAAPCVVVQGWAPEVGWPLLAEAAVALNAGVPWIATNVDRTLPSPRGPLPGNGSLVAALRTATGREPEVVGKPHRPLFDAALTRSGARRALVVGDRLDTDVAGAAAAGLPSLAVLSGVASPRDLLAAAPQQRPAYLGRDLRAVLSAHPAVEVTAGSATCGAVTVTAHGEVTARREPAGDGLDGLRAACALAWNGELAPERFDACLRDLGWG